MQQQLEHIKRIQGKVEDLIQRQQDLKKENEQLRGEIADWKEKNRVQTELTSQLTEQVELLKLSTSQGWDDETRKSFEKRLQQYIKEIDRCLAMLND